MHIQKKIFTQNINEMVGKNLVHFVQTKKMDRKLVRVFSHTSIQFHSEKP